jgi:hypothetical protein
MQTTKENMFGVAEAMSSSSSTQSLGPPTIYTHHLEEIHVLRGISCLI